MTSAAVNTCLRMSQGCRNTLVANQSFHKHDHLIPFGLILKKRNRV